MNGEKVTELAPARPTPSRAARERDERVRVVRKIRKHATWLEAPHFATLLYTYGALWVRFVDLRGVEAEPVDELGRPNAITDQLTRIAARLGQLAAQLGLSPAASARCDTMPPARSVSRDGSRWPMPPRKRSRQPHPRPRQPARRHPLPRTARSPEPLLSKVELRYGPRLQAPPFL